ncbi:MAG: hypothetical protein RDU76_06260 [Candidatus Edwardsbacteria bacterium]|nr:hypothetical protein [Candidatus Edwardsbacteria bacterium]
MKKIILSFCLGLVLIGCAKDPVAVDQPVIPSLSSSNISSSLFSTVCISYNGVSYDTFGIAALDVKIIGKFQGFDYIKTSSDSVGGFCYLHNSKMIEIPFDHALPPYCSYRDTSNASLWIVYYWYPLSSDPINPSFSPLLADDTLTSIDSTIAYFSWWYDNQRYQVRRKL